MELFSTIVGKVIELTVEPIGRQVGYLIFYQRNLNQLNDEFQELQAKREGVQHLVDVAQRNGDEIEAQVRDWFRLVDEITERKEKLYVDKSHVETGCSYKSCLNLCLQHQLSRKAKNMKLEVAKIKEKGNFGKVSFNKLLSGEDLSSTSIERIESRISTMNDVLKALVDSRFNMIGLCGIGGVGKTTLATKVAKKVKEENLFDMVVMVKVTQHPVLKEIQRQIAENVGMNFKVETESIRAGRLYNRLKQEKKLLLVVDDLWERLDLYQVGIPFDFDGKKKNPLDDENDKHYTKILLTSRNEELLSNQMKCKRIIKVGVLSESEAWELFKEKAELHDDSNDPYLLDVAVEVAKRCGGLPLAIVAVARALRKKELSGWRDALHRLKRPSRRNIIGIKEVDSSLKLSYDNLDNQELQSIFLLSAMLSHDPLVIDLLMYSMGLSLLLDVRSMEEAQDGLDALVNTLKASNLLLDGISNDRFTMHDVIRDVALWIASKEQNALVVRQEKQYELPEQNLIKGCTRLCLDKCDITKLPEELYCPRLEFFLLDNEDSDLRIPNMFFKYMQELKVMSFTKMHFSSLPSSLGLLEKIKTLCLHSCTLEDIAEVGKLKKLKVLSLAYSIITRLPFELRGLTCLQMLNLTHCSKLEEVPLNLLSSLKRLEVLSMENSFHQWAVEGSSKGNDNASLMELKLLPNLSSLDIHIPSASMLPKDLFFKNSLKRYKIFIGQHWKWLGQYETSKTLKLKLESSIHLDLGVQKLLESVEDLHLDKLYGINNVINDLDMRGFRHLKHLWIQNNGQIEYIINSTRLVEAFPNLETLNLHNLSGLEKLCQGQVTATYFKNLRVIRVSCCNRLKVLFSMSMVGLLGSLVEIDIYECESIKGIVVSNNENTSKQNFATDIIKFHQLRSLKMVELPTLMDFFHENTTNNGDNQNFKSLFSNKVLFPNLEILEISKVNIEYVWNEQLVDNSFSNLKTLVVRNCGFLVKLIPLHILKCLSNLEKLEVFDCDSLKLVFDFEELKGILKGRPSLLAIIKLKPWLPILKHAWTDDSTGIVFCQRLRRVIVWRCKSLTSIFPALIAKSLPHLEELSIRSSGVEVIVAEDEVLESVATFVLPKLTSLQLYFLDNMKTFYRLKHSLECPRLQELFIEGCDGLEIFQEILTSPISQEKNSTSCKYPLFFQEKQIPNLEKLTLGRKHAMMIWNDQFPKYHFPRVRYLSLGELPNDAKTFSHDLLKRFPNLEELRVGSSSIQEIFSCTKAIVDDAGQIAPFRKLTLDRMRELKHIWNEHSQMDLFLRNLRSLNVEGCSAMINLGISSISLKNLTDLNVDFCDRMQYLLISSTARSLVQLTRLKISFCDQIEEIIKEQREDAKKEIVFKKLEHLRLYSLPRLKSFCSHNYTIKFPRLNEEIIEECPNLKVAKNDQK